MLDVSLHFENHKSDRNIILGLVKITIISNIFSQKMLCFNLERMVVGFTNTFAISAYHH